MGYDPVTIADRAAEQVIRAEIARAYPDHGIHGEEQGKQEGTSPLTWVIDPIDGTRSFILGQLHWATLIALHDGERPVVGVVHQPFVGEILPRPRGAGWRNGGVATRRAHCARAPAPGSRMPSLRRRTRGTSSRRASLPSTTPFPAPRG